MEHLENVQLPPYEITDTSKPFDDLHRLTNSIRTSTAIIIPTKNEGSRPDGVTYLQRRLASLETSLAKMANAVVIVSDCRSTDNTQEVWKAWINANPNIPSIFMQTAIPEEFNGAAVARNNGALVARRYTNLDIEGTYIFLDADGDFEDRERALPSMLREMRANKWVFASPLIGLGYENDGITRHWPEKVTNWLQEKCEGRGKPFTYGGTLLVNTSAFLEVGGFPARKEETEVGEDLKLGQRLARTYGKDWGGIVESGGKAVFSNRRENNMRKQAEQSTRAKLQGYYDTALRTAKNEGQALALNREFEAKIKKAGDNAVREYSLNFSWAIMQHLAGVEHIKAPVSHAEFAAKSK